jgi:transcriptional regulator with PAS, ATPase and Fis domain
LERTLASLEGSTVFPQDLPFYVTRRHRTPDRPPASSIKEIQAKVQRDTILRALKECDYNKTLAAKRLGIHRTLLYKKMKTYKIGLKPD